MGIGAHVKIETCRVGLLKTCFRLAKVAALWFFLLALAPTLVVACLPPKCFVLKDMFTRLYTEISIYYDIKPMKKMKTVLSIWLRPPNDEMSRHSLKLFDNKKGSSSRKLGKSHFRLPRPHLLRSCITYNAPSLLPFTPSLCPLTPLVLPRAALLLPFPTRNGNSKSQVWGCL